MPVNPLVDVKNDLVDITGTASAGAVTAVSGNAPITSSGGTTPAIGLTTPLALNYGGTSVDLSATGGAKNYVKQAGVGAAFTVGTIPSTDVGTGALLADGSVPLSANFNASSGATNPPKTIQYGNSTAWYNVVAWGADPTGAADSTTAVQNAVNAAIAASGGTIYFPSGNYKLVSTITVSKSGLSFVGDNQQGAGGGQYGTNIIVNTTTDGFNITSNVGAAVTFRDITFSTISNAYATAGAMIHANGSALFPLYVRNCLFIYYYRAIQMTSCNFSVIRDNVFQTGTPDGTSTGGVAVYHNNTVNSALGDNIIDSNNFSGNGGTYDILWDYGADLRICNNAFGGTTLNPIYVNIAAGQTLGTCSNCYVFSNKFENETNYSVAIVPASPFLIIGIYGNYFNSTAGGVNISPTAAGTAQYGLIASNTFRGNGTCIKINPAAAAGADQWHIGNNQFLTPSTAAISLPATVGFCTNLKIARNQYVQSGTVPYVSGAFSSSSGFDPGIETVFVQTANSTTTANSASTIFGAGNGSLTIPAGRLMVGSRVRIYASGFVGTADGGAAVKTIVFSLGGVTIATATTASTTSTLNSPWAIQECHFTVRTTGAGGTGYGYILAQDPGIWSCFAVSTATFAINTTNALAVNITYNNGNATGSLTTTEATVEILDAKGST